MCEGTASSLPYDAPADPTSETRQQRIARKIMEAKAKGTWGGETPPAAPTLSDTVITEAGQSALLKARMGRGRRSTMLAAGSIGDSSSLLGY